MRHEKAWLILGWSALAVLLFHVLASAAPPGRTPIDAIATWFGDMGERVSAPWCRLADARRQKAEAERAASEERWKAIVARAKSSAAESEWYESRRKLMEVMLDARRQANASLNRKAWEDEALLEGVMIVGDPQAEAERSKKAKPDGTTIHDQRSLGEQLEAFIRQIDEEDRRSGR